MVTVWIDIKNSHEPAFFRSILKGLAEHEVHVTTRDYAEIIGLMKKFGIPYQNIGGRVQGNFLKRVLGFYGRALRLALKVPGFDVSISHSSGHAILASKWRRRPHIAFTDNDINYQHNERIFKHLKYLVIPAAIPKEKMLVGPMKSEDVFQFHGFKEDIYIADFSPDQGFLDELPFDDFVTVRPESLQAMYVPRGVKSIVPELLRLLERENINVLFLPRYESDREYARGLSTVHMPSGPLNGLDVCYYSRAMLTGAGTFAREAACMGTPAVSFFPGETLLAVDQRMVEDGWSFHSRSPEEIVDHVLASGKRQVDLSRSRDVQEEVFGILGRIFEKVGETKKVDT